MNPKTILKLLKDTFAEWQEDKASRLAAALAYYTVFSIAPLLIIVIAIAAYPPQKKQLWLGVSAFAGLNQFDEDYRGLVFRGGAIKALDGSRHRGCRETRFINGKLTNSFINSL